MKAAAHNVIAHLAAILGTSTLLDFVMGYPFVPGTHDRLAVPLSTMAQVSGVVGLALVPGGLLWIVMPRHGFALAVLATAVGTGVALILAPFATLSVGSAFGVLTLAGWVYVLVRLMPWLTRLKSTEGRPSSHDSCSIVSARGSGLSTIRATGIECTATRRGSFHRPTWRSRARAGTRPATPVTGTGCTSCLIDGNGERQPNAGCSGRRLAPPLNLNVGSHQGTADPME